MLPAIGKIISKDKSAYKYLPDSVKEFPTQDNFMAILRSEGFENIQAIDNTFGIVTVFTAYKK